MSFDYSRRSFLARAAAGTWLVAPIGCGTILYPERRGQPAGDLDWTIVALDAIGLMLFFVPGVIAFAVDFNNGTIYLPPDGYGRSSDSTDVKLQKVDVPVDELSRERVERVVSQHIGAAVDLQPGSYRAETLRDIDEFPRQERRMASMRAPSAVRFRCQSP